MPRSKERGTNGASRDRHRGDPPPRRLRRGGLGGAPPEERVVPLEVDEPLKQPVYAPWMVWSSPWTKGASGGFVQERGEPSGMTVGDEGVVVTLEGEPAVLLVEKL